jgi:hypothetical protein
MFLRGFKGKRAGRRKAPGRRCSLEKGFFTQKVQLKPLLSLLRDIRYCQHYPLLKNSFGGTFYKKGLSRIFSAIYVALLRNYETMSSKKSPSRYIATSRGNEGMQSSDALVDIPRGIPQNIIYF